MADDIVSWREFGGDDSRTGEVVADELVSDPVSGGDNGGLGDFVPAERARAEVGAIAVARGNVVDDRALVAVWPCVPCELNQVSSIDIGIEFASGSALVAIYIAAANLRWFYKAEILVERIPTSSLRSVVRVVEPDWVRSFSPSSLHVDACNKAVCGGSIKKPSDCAEYKDRSVHSGEKIEYE